MEIRRFGAMGSPCEILFDTPDPRLADEQAALAQQEAERIEERYSRYRPDSIVSQINRSAGRRLRVDNETAELLDYAAECFEMSNGLFDITASKTSRGPWSRVLWRRPWITLPAGVS